MLRAKFKRFYETVSVAADPVEGRALRILLDGRPIKTPAKAEMVLPGRPLAEAMAEEWRRQGEEVDPRAMPLTALATTALDVIAPDRARVVDEITAYAGHDLLCYRAAAPADLTARQQALWQPLLDWAALTLDAPLIVTAGVVSVPQPPEALAALRRAVAQRSDLGLAALSSAVTAAGSVIVGLALVEGRLDATTALEAAQLDETYQMERWGEDPEAARRRDAIRADLAAAAQFVELLRA